VVNFYHLCRVADPEAETAAHREFCRGRDIRGRIYLSWQGINAQLSGTREDAHAYAEWVAGRPGFGGLAWRTERVPAHMFPRLTLKFRESLISMAGGTKHLPVGEEGYLPEHLEPGQWREMIRAARAVRAGAGLGDGVDLGALPAPVAERAGKSALDEIVVLDLRNDYEWDVGHFEGADRPRESRFSETPTESTDDLQVPAYMEGKDKDTPVMMYCTGGIRCDVYAAHLRTMGYRNVYALGGGVHRYFEEVGGDEWDGSLYVFDGRVAVPAERPEESERRWREGREGEVGSLEGHVPGRVNSCLAHGQTSPFRGLRAAAGCRVCGGEAEAPPINCANIDCNRIFLACPGCKQRLLGCCGRECVEAPRLRRPVQDAPGNYAKWNKYAPEGERINESRIGRRRRERRARKSREAAEAKREQREARKEMAAAAMRDSAGGGGGGA